MAAFASGRRAPQQALAGLGVGTIGITRHRYKQKYRYSYSQRFRHRHRQPPGIVRRGASNAFNGCR